MDQVLFARGVPEDGTKYVTIRASRNQSWDKYAKVPEGLEIAATNELVKTLAPDEEFMGVYETAKEERKAWLIHVASEYDPKGTIFIIR